MAPVMNNGPAPPVDQSLLEVIKDFLNRGHVDNIAAMLHRNVCPLNWSGAILDDERLTVRLGVSVLFEELKRRMPERLNEAIDSLMPLLESEHAYMRGDTLSVLAVIGTPEAAAAISTLTDDPDPQVREIVAEILTELTPRPGDEV